MADSYLEKRFEEFRNPEKKVVRKGGLFPLFHYKGQSGKTQYSLRIR